jgi:hypothetical protein
VLREQEDIAVALAQRGQHEGDDADAVIEVRAEAALAHGRGEVLVRRADHPRVRRLGARCAKTADALVLQRFQQLRLKGGRQEPDLVEEDRAAMRDLEQAGLRAPRVGERAALEAEHLGFEEVLGNRSAVHVDERGRRARARAMHRAREQAFARAGFTLDQHRRQPTPFEMPAEQPRDALPKLDELRADPQKLGQGVHQRPHLTPGHW